MAISPRKVSFFTALATFGNTLAARHAKQNGDHLPLTVRLLRRRQTHSGILPVSIVTFLLSSTCGLASAHQISSESDHPQQSYDVIAIFKMAAVSHVGFGLW